MNPITCDSIADFPPEKYRLLAYCSDCHRNPEIDRKAIDPQTKIDALRAHLQCTECGSRQTQLYIVWHGGTGSERSHWGMVSE